MSGDESSYSSNPDQVDGESEEPEYRWVDELFDTGTIAKGMEGYSDLRSLSTGRHLPSHHAEDGVILGGSIDDDNEEDGLHRPSLSRYSEDDCKINLEDSDDDDNDDADDDSNDDAPAKKRIRFLIPLSGCSSNIDDVDDERSCEDEEGKEVEVEEQILKGGQGIGLSLMFKGSEDSPIMNYMREAYHNNINNLNEQKGFIGGKARIQKTSKMGVDSIAPSMRDTALAALKKFLPHIDEVDPQAQQLIKNVSRAAAKMCSPLTDESDLSEYKAAVDKICESLTQVIPQKALFNLLSRWARRSKSNFQRNAINVVTVLAHQCGMTVVDFLDMARKWRYQPVLKHGRRRSHKLSYVRVKENDSQFDNVVNKFHLTCIIMDSSMKGKLIGSLCNILLFCCK
jgi:hypothetical protein